MILGLMIKNKLSCVDWKPIYASKDVIHAYDMFYSIFYRIYNEYLPVVRNKRIIKNRIIHKPWISSGIIKSINKKNTLYKDFRKYSGPLKTKRKKKKKKKKSLIKIIRSVIKEIRNTIIKDLTS